MTKWIGNRIGSLVNAGADGGIFNFFDQYRFQTDNDWIPRFLVTGGTKIPSAVSGNSYTYHVFTTAGPSSLTCTLTESTQFQFFVVGGGGAGGFDVGGGGGAGGIAVVPPSQGFTGQASRFTANVVVGRGGIAATTSGGAPSDANGVDSSINFLGNLIVGKGGGLGGNYSGGSGESGGCGGGASGYSSPGQPGPTIQSNEPTFGGKVTHWGYAGGGVPGSGTPWSGGGGGGAGGAGGAGQSGGTASGGPGRTFADYTSTILAPALPSAAQSAIGSSGLYAVGGNATYDGGPNPEVPGVENTGGGGFGAGSPNQGTSGGSGIVVVRYIEP